MLKIKPVNFGTVGKTNRSSACVGRGDGAIFYKAVEQFLHTKIVEGRAKEDRSYLSTAIGLDVKSWIDPFYKFQVTTQLLGNSSHLGIELFQTGYRQPPSPSRAACWESKRFELFFVDIIDALEALTWPIRRESSRAWI